MGGKGRLSRGSPAGLPDYVTQVDEETLWAAKVDDVYVWSVGGRQYQQELDELRRSNLWYEAFGYVLLAVAVLLIMPLFRSTVAMVVAAAALVLSSSAGQLTQSTCYIMSPLFCSRRGEMTAVQRDLLEKHHAAGVIGEEAYRHALRAIDLTPTTPAQKPREARAD